MTLKEIDENLFNSGRINNDILSLEVFKSADKSFSISCNKFENIFISFGALPFRDRSGCIISFSRVLGIGEIGLIETLDVDC